jgi:transposase
VDTVVVKSRFEPVAASGERRGPYRKHSLEAKRAIVQQCLVPRASVAAVALAHGVNANLVRKWIDKYRAGEYGEVQTAMTLLPVTVSEAPATSASSPSASTPKGHIDIELPAGRVRVHGSVDLEALRVVLTSLAR